jgi:hypothetical protein
MIVVVMGSTPPHPELDLEGRLSVPPLLREARESGSPAWLPDEPGLRWRSIAACVWRSRNDLIALVGPSVLPQLSPSVERPGYGRPRLAEIDPERAEFIAWAHDVCGLSHRALARLLYPSLSDDDLSDRAERAQVRRYVKAGRAALSADGVLPWASYDDGALPDAWWRDETFAADVQSWLDARRIEPAEPVSSAVEQAVRRLTPRLTSRLRRTLADANGDPLWHWRG